MQKEMRGANVFLKWNDSGISKKAGWRNFCFWLLCKNRDSRHHLLLSFFLHTF